jgi:hypothetical protein
MTDDNIIGIDGPKAAQLPENQAQREKREEILRTQPLHDCPSASSAATVP